MSSMNLCVVKLPSMINSIEWNFSIPDIFGLPKECPGEKHFVSRQEKSHFRVYFILCVGDVLQCRGILISEICTREIPLYTGQSVDCM